MRHPSRSRNIKLLEREEYTDGGKTYMIQKLPSYEGVEGYYNLMRAVFGDPLDETKYIKDEYDGWEEVG